MLIQLESAFWKQVQEVVPPAMDGSEAAAKFLSERFPNSVSKSKIELPEPAIELIRQYEIACDHVNQYAEKKQEAENMLKNMLGNNEIGMVDDRVVTWKSVAQERLDGKTLKIEHPTLYKKYANKTSYRRFSIKAAM